MTRERMVSSQESGDETEFYKGLRPQSLDEYIGQPATVERLRIAIEAARAREES